MTFTSTARPAEERGITVEEWMRGPVEARVPASLSAHLQHTDPKESSDNLKNVYGE